MSRQTIAIDIDDVLAINVPAFVAYSNERWGTNLGIGDFREDWIAMWQVDYDEVVARARELDEIGLVTKYEHFSEAEHVLRELKKRFKLVITTSRRSTLTAQTASWINRYFPNMFEEVHHAGIFDDMATGAHLRTKAELCRQIGADYLIDDHPKHCFAAAEAGIPTLLFGQYPWNQNIDTLPPNVTRAADWHAVGEYFNATR